VEFSLARSELGLFLFTDTAKEKLVEREREREESLPRRMKGIILWLSGARRAFRGRRTRDAACSAQTNEPPKSGTSHLPPLNGGLIYRSSRCIRFAQRFAGNRFRMANLKSA
jgi:hypothetical protein